MPQWNVERVAQTTRPGNPRFTPPPIVDAIEADELVVDAGALVFTEGGVVTQAYGTGTWAAVTRQEDGA
jgi:hypothetical protein